MHTAVAQAALAQGATILEIKGELYAASWFDVGWWVWKLEHDSDEHFVLHDFSSCSCEQFRKFRSCKHVVGLRARFG